VDPTFGELVAGALRLDRASFELVQNAANGERTALTVLLLAGVSETLGQAVVLVLNRVSRARFALALGLGGLELVVEALVWIASMWLVVGQFVAERPPFLSAVRVIGLAYAPLLLSGLVFLPYLGPILARLLRLWTLLAIVVGTSVVFGLPPQLAALAAASGFLMRWVLLRVFGGVSTTVQRWLWHASTGRAGPLRSTDALLTFDVPERRR
jgi:hypothetical protein